ncbi:hypothetical protein KPH14_011704 [Odynerus spinipes]|uniref:Uncharacterized protein n=1 Tax=Odynerus spinipes TaxID=1348599 RepID=A0AAD9RVJ3_9HYME|nr:hypothetical protein KPH14_011704 [Odynerus spinipes]
MDDLKLRDHRSGSFGEFCGESEETVAWESRKDISRDIVIAGQPGFFQGRTTIDRENGRELQASFCSQVMQHVTARWQRGHLPVLASLHSFEIFEDR